MKNFCTQCNRIVPQDQIKETMIFDPNIFIASLDETLNSKTILTHEGTSYVNMNGSSPGYNFCGGNVYFYCGEVKEPTPEEYFIYETLK